MIHETEGGCASLQVRGNHSLAGAPEMQSHSSLGVIAIPRENRIYDPEVLLLRENLYLCAFLAQISGKRGNVSKLIVEIHQGPVGRGFRQMVVELTPQVYRLRRLDRRIDFFEFRAQQNNPLPELRFKACGGQACQGTLDRFPGDKDLQKILYTELSDGVSTAPIQNDQSIGNQLAKCFAYGCTTDVVL